MASAFSVSLVDLIKKLRYRYENPIDFVSNYMSLLYSPEKHIGISIYDDRLEITSPSIEEELQNKLEGSVYDAIGLIPPSAQFADVAVDMGNTRYTIRKGEIVQAAIDGQDSTKISIMVDESISEDAKARLVRLYSFSDMSISLDGKPLPVFSDAFNFDELGFQGKIYYDPSSVGLINYYSKGRHISSEPFVDGINMALYHHGFSTTITNSDIILDRAGKKRHVALDSILPSLLMDYVKHSISSEVPVESVQVMLRSIASRYFDVPEIASFVKENLLIRDRSGIYLKGAEDIIEKDYSHMTSLEKKILGIKQEKETVDKEFSLSLKKQRKNRNFFGKHPVYMGLSSLLIFGALSLPHLINRYQDVGLSRNAYSAATAHDGLVGGSHYQDMDSLVQILAAQDGSEGYRRFETYSDVLVTEEGVFWSDPDDNRLVITGDSIIVPTELYDALPENPKFRDLVNTTYFYIQDEFLYGPLPLEVSGLYDSQLDAMIVARRMLCDSANSYGILLLGNLMEENGYRMDKVRYAIGTYGGVPHAWAEVKRFGIWRIVDYTPSMMDPSLLKELGAELLDQDRFFDTQDDSLFKKIREICASITNPRWKASRDSSYSGSDDLYFPDGGVICDGSGCGYGAGITPEGIAKSLGLAAVGFAGIYSIYRLIKDKVPMRLLWDKRIPLVSAEYAGARKLSDLLDMDIIYSSDQDVIAYDRKTDILNIPKGHLAMDPVKLAIGCVPYITSDIEKQMALYEKVTEKALTGCR